jgi:hypothetical protein
VTARDVARRLEAYAAGRPVPRGATRQLQIADDEDLLALAFVRMGGESLPWAVGIVSPGGRPRVFAVPDARNRDRVAEMVTELTPHLARHFDHPQWSEGDVTTDDPPESLALRQVWVPNGSHVHLLHMLNLRYTFARAGDPVRAATLRALGRLAGYLFRDAVRPGQATIVDASAALREGFTFPVDDLRQQHLSLLLALLGEHPTREEREAAAEDAERWSVSASLDPKLERDELEPEVERYTDARRQEKQRQMAASESRIVRVLEAEVRRRLDLVETAVKVLREDPRSINRGAADLALASKKARQQDFLWFEEQIALRGEEGYFPPSPETDRDRRSAAARYHRLSSADDEVAAALVHDDRELQDDLIAAGDALRGTIVEVKDRAPAGSRAVMPVWEIEAPSSDPSRLRRGTGVCVAGMPRRKGTVLSISATDGVRRLEVEINGWKRKPDAARYPDYADALAAADRGHIGQPVVLLPSALAGIGVLKSRRVREAIGPGTWLTHGTGTPPSRARRRRGGDVLAEVDRLRAP